MNKWTEVDAYSGQPMEEKAPTNNAGSGKVAMPPDAMMKKKKKTFLDARTKAYKEHQKRLEASRQRREERRKTASKINEGELKEIKKASLQFSLGMNSDMMKAKKDLEKKGHKVKVSGNKMTVTAKSGSDINRELSDIRNFYDRGVKIKAEQTEETLDEGKFKVGDTVIPSVGPHKGRKHEVIADLKNNTYNIKPIGLLAKQIQYRLGAAKAKANQIKLVKEETLDEGKMKELAMKIAQVYSNMKKDKNMRSFADKFRKDVAKSLDIRKSLEKVLPDYVAGKDITNIMSKHVPGHKEENKVEEKLDKDDEEEVKGVIKGLKKAVKTHDGQVKDLEKAVNEWFKSKNIDVKVRELDESTQVYVPLGRRIPNEIREELITTQYGKMPEDVKNVKDINYGNFMENSITMNNDFWTKVLHGTKGE